MLFVLHYLFFVILFSGAVQAEESTFAQSGRSGGADLEFPSGRFQETSLPNFFRWNPTKKVYSYSIKVYRTDPAGNFDASSDLVNRFDFLGTINYVRWNKPKLGVGHYIWFLESYNKVDSKPIFVDSLKFKIEELKYFNAKTERVGAIVGFSRGTQTVEDSNYTLAYKTTPTHYGLNYVGNKKNNIINVYGTMSDFVFQGALQNTAQIELDYLYFLERKTKTFNLYLGPTVRYYDFMRVRTSDGSNMTAEKISLFNFGASLLVQKKFDTRVNLYSKLKLDTHVTGSESVVMGLDQLSYDVRAGILYGLFWPIGFAGEFMFKQQNSKTSGTDGEVIVKQQDWGVMANLVYAF